MQNVGGRLLAPTKRRLTPRMPVVTSFIPPEWRCARDHIASTYTTDADVKTEASNISGFTSSLRDPTLVKTLSWMLDRSLQGIGRELILHGSALLFLFIRKYFIRNLKIIIESRRKSYTSGKTMYRIQICTKM